jgi:hypothetical protein
LAWVFGVAVAFLAAWSITGGMVWSICFHPDELTIARWTDVVNRRGYLTTRAYPTGWFELMRAKFWLEEKKPQWQESWEKHLIQEGRVNAVAEGTFGLREAEPIPKKLQHTIQDGRDFNAWLYVLTALFLYAACLEAGFHPAAAFVSGLFFLGTAGPLEFAHYCETDGALLVSMAFFAWLSARALRKKSVWLALLGAVAAGFAVACKFTLAPLLLWCVAGPAAVLWGKRGEWGRVRWWGTVAGLVLLGAGLAFGGYVLGTPAARIAPEWYMKALKHAKKATYSEIRTFLGGHYTWSGATVLRTRLMLGHLYNMGLLPLVWGAFAWAFWFARANRRQLAGLPWLLPVFFPFWVCCCPFVRRQELLPLAILLAFGAALPLQWWFAGGARAWGTSRRKKVAAWALAALGAGALFVQGGKALATKSCFQLRDTRAEAQNWLRDAMPTETPVSLDAYVTQVNRGVWFKSQGYSGLPYRWTGTRPPHKGGEPLYYVENVGHPGRLPIRSPKTGMLYPEVKESLAAFEADLFPVRTWKVSKTTPIPMFAQRTTRLLAFDKPPAGAPDVAIGHARPILVQPNGSSLYGAAGPAGVGPLHAIHTVGKRTRVFLNPEDGERWLVTRWMDGEGGPVKVVREGLFRPEKSELAAGGAVAAKLAPSVGDRLAARLAAHAVSKCRMRGDDQTVNCASYLAQSAAEAARELRVAGNARGALDLLKAEKKLDDAGRVEAFLAASASGEAPEADWVEVARAAAEGAERLVAERDRLGRAGASICGVPLGVLEDFARLKMGKMQVSPGTRCQAWLPPGRYTVSVALRGEEPAWIPERLFEGQATDFAVEDMQEGNHRLTASLDVAAGGFLRVAGEEGEEDGFEPFWADLEIGWSPVDRAAETAEVIRGILARSGAAAAKTGDET